MLEARGFVVVRVLHREYRLAGLSLDVGVEDRADPIVRDGDEEEAAPRREAGEAAVDG